MRTHTIQTNMRRFKMQSANHKQGYFDPDKPGMVVYVSSIGIIQYMIRDWKDGVAFLRSLSLVEKTMTQIRSMLSRISGMRKQTREETIKETKAEGTIKPAQITTKNRGINRRYKSLKKSVTMHFRNLVRIIKEKNTVAYKTQPNKNDSKTSYLDTHEHVHSFESNALALI